MGWEDEVHYAEVTAQGIRTVLAEHVGEDRPVDALERWARRPSSRSRRALARLRRRPPEVLRGLIALPGLLVRPILPNFSPRLFPGEESDMTRWMTAAVVAVLRNGVRRGAADSGRAMVPGRSRRSALRRRSARITTRRPSCICSRHAIGSRRPRG